MGSSDPQVALLLLRLCGSFCCGVHLARSTPPSLIYEGLALFDDDVRRCFAECTMVDTSDIAWRQAQLSLSRGGIGLRCLSLHSSVACIASIIASSYCSKQSTHLPHYIDLFNSSVSSVDALTIDTISIAIKWWLGLPTSQDQVCPQCSSHSLDCFGHHALTCRKGPDVVTRHNRIRDTVFELCQLRSSA